MSTQRHWQGTGLAWLPVVAILCLLAIFFLVQEVTRDLRLLRADISDDGQWSLAQAEVEFLDFQRTLEKARLSDPPDLDELRLEYDILYSRIDTIAEGTLYANMRQRSEVARALARVREFLEASVPLIDAPDAEFVAGLDDLAAQTESVRLQVRRLANSGLFYFAEESDARRAAVSSTLFRLALVTTALIVALALMAYRSHSAGRAARQRGQQLAASNARLNVILSTSLDGIVVADLQGRILEFNRAAEKIFGHRAEDVQGQMLGELIVPPHLRDAHDAGMARLQASGETHMIGRGRVQLEALRANGEVFPVEIALETEEAGGETIVVGFLRDISLRVAAERELLEARDRALAGEQAKSDFLAVMTHEIRTPLNGILGHIGLLEESGLTNQQSRYLRNMRISGRILMQHVDAVMDIASFESGKLRFDARPVHLGRLLQDVTDSQSGAATRQGNRLSWTWVGPPVDWVTVDPARLQQILLNLLGNAIKFTHQGQITIEVEQVHSVAPGGGRELEFRIIDTGIGIDEEELPRIFEDFRTNDSSYGRIAGGTGLGLGIARRLTRGMAGEIGAESSLGDGSVFWVRLPLVEAKAPARGSDGADAYGPGDALEILVVEDNAINLELVRELLSVMGHRVREAENGLVGLQMASEQRFDLILMDISMPVMDGLEATRRIRTGFGPSADAPIVALSANVLAKDQRRFHEAGVSGFLGKPFEKTELSAVLARFSSSAAAPAAATPDVSPEVMASLRARFLSEAETLVESLEAAPADHSRLAGECHRVAGSAAIFEAHGLRASLLALQEAAETGDGEAVRRGIARVREDWEETRVAL